ncbi:MAG: lysophospholipid acyltransferase family protein [Bacteroidia bacterium]|nr:lysophospholipid acyltransferase family protein [Bacteroidia bacterium]
MNFLNNLFYYGLIIPVSVLPYPILYGLSDVMYYVIYYMVGYRKKVVLQNIKNSFPEKTNAEHIEIAKKYFRHFCDLTLESLKVFTISEREVRNRMILKNPEVINDFFDQRKSVIIAGGHYNNWELFAVAIASMIKHRAIGIYKPFTSKYFDEKMRVTRSKYGLWMISTKIVKQVFDSEKNNLTATIFGIDQSPPFADKCHWMTFLNQDTGVLFGVEKYAKEYNYPVVFCRINKEKRGYYSFEFENITDLPNQTTQGEIIEKATRLLELDILKQPEYWLWSHKRWKHKRPSIQ